MPVKRKPVPGSDVDDSKTTSLKKPKITVVTKTSKNTNVKQDEKKKDDKKVLRSKGYSMSAKMLNTTKLLFMIMNDGLNDLQPVVEYVKSMGTDGFDLLNVPGRERSYATNEILKVFKRMSRQLKPTRTESDDYKKQQTNWNVISRYLLYPLLNDTMSNNMFCCCMANNQFWSEPYKYKTLPTMFESVPIGEDHGLVQLIRKTSTTEYIVALISRCTDSYLNIVSRCAPDGSLMTPLKAAVKFGMYEVADALLRRFPWVDFDIVHPDLPLAEPVYLSVDLNRPNLAHITNVVQVGESIVQNYYRDLHELIMSLKNGHCLPNPDLLNIIWSYAQRMPLSTTVLTWPLPSPPSTTATTTAKSKSI